MTKLRILDLFSGIGGFSLGLERAGGFETVAFCEIEPFCRSVLADRWPGVPIYNDVRTISSQRLIADGIAVDVICGGFPCQDISDAGHQAGIAGQRSGLWFEYARLIDEIRPAYVIVENVAALLVRGLDRVLRSLAEIGYDAEWHCIPASYVGAPHRRDRVWLVAYPPGDRCQGELREDCRLSTLQGLALEALDAWHGSGSPFCDWQKLLAEPPTCRMDDGVSSYVDIRPRLHAFGNAVVPQISELIGRAIMAAEQAA